MDFNEQCAVCGAPTASDSFALLLADCILCGSCLAAGPGRAAARASRPEPRTLAEALAIRPVRPAGGAEPSRNPTLSPKPRTEPVTEPDGLTIDGKYRP